MGSRKKELRSELRRVVANLDERWEKAASLETCNRLKAFMSDGPGRFAEHVLAWIPSFPGEVDLSPLIAHELRTRRVYLPKMVGKNLEFVELLEDWGASLERNSLGVWEPVTGKGIFDPAIAAQSVILTPGLAFDREGNRLGRGKGYYDRFMANASVIRAIKVGVCWSIQLLDKVPSDSFDVPMDWVCHERELISTGLRFAEEYEG